MNNYYASSGVSQLALQEQIRSKIISFFRSRKALSEATSIKLEEIDFAEMGISMLFNMKREKQRQLALEFYGIRTEDGVNYWFDFELSKQKQKRAYTAYYWVLGVMFVAIILFVIFAF